MVACSLSFTSPPEDKGRWFALVSAVALFLIGGACSRQGIRAPAGTSSNTGFVDGGLISPSSDRYSVSQVPCVFSDSAAPKGIGTMIRTIELGVEGGGSVLREITKANIRGTAVIDTLTVDRRTLRPHWNRNHIGGLSSGFTVADTVVTWRVSDPSTGEEVHDTSLTESPVFSAGSEVLIAQGLVAPEQYVRGAPVRIFLFSVGGLEHWFQAGEGSIAVDSVKGGAQFDSGLWHVTLTSEFEVQAWVTAGGNRLVRWRVAGTEGECPVEYTRR